MVKAKAGKLLIFGISEENVRRLKKDQPISIDLVEMQAQGMEHIVIFYGKTEDDLVRKMTPFITKETKIHEA